MPKPNKFKIKPNPAAYYMIDGETRFPLPSGTILAFDAPQHDCNDVSTVRLLDTKGKELVMWTAQEWQDDPTSVMGAICNGMTMTPKEIKKALAIQS